MPVDSSVVPAGLGRLAYSALTREGVDSYSAAATTRSSRRRAAAMAGSMPAPSRSTLATSDTVRAPTANSEAIAGAATRRAAVSHWTFKSPGGSSPNSLAASSPAPMREKSGGGSWKCPFSLLGAARVALPAVVWLLDLLERFPALESDYDLDLDLSLRSLLASLTSLGPVLSLCCCCSRVECIRLPDLAARTAISRVSGDRSRCLPCSPSPSTQRRTP